MKEYTLVPDFRIKVRAHDAEQATIRGRKLMEDAFENGAVAIMMDGDPVPLTKRFVVVLEVEVDAETEQAAVKVAGDLCTAISAGAEALEYWGERGVRRLAFAERGDGPIVEEVGDDD